MLRKCKSQDRLGENIRKAYIWFKKNTHTKLVSILYKEFSKLIYKNTKQNETGITQMWWICEHMFKQNIHQWQIRTYKGA